MTILRAFRPGSSLLGNGELSERTGLSRPTVTRLTQTLVGCGALERDARTGTYRLGPLMLSLGLSMRNASICVSKGLPVMSALAEKYRVNVGLSIADRDEMVYLESLRVHRSISPRHIVAGQRVPIELTSLGRAYLSTLTLKQRTLLYDVFAQRNPRRWPQLQLEIERSLESMEAEGYCSASWHPGVIALATPVRCPDLPVHVLNMSLASAHPLAKRITELADHLMEASHQIALEVERAR